MEDLLSFFEYLTIGFLWGFGIYVLVKLSISFIKEAIQKIKEYEESHGDERSE